MPVVPKSSHKTRNTIIVAVVAVVLVSGGVGITIWLNKSRPKHKPMIMGSPVVPKNTTYYPTVSASDVARAHETVAVEGIVQSFDGKVIGFLAYGSKQVLKLNVNATTAYSKGDSYASATADALKAGSHAVINYNSTTNVVASVAYDL